LNRVLLIYLTWGWLFLHTAAWAQVVAEDKAESAKSITKPASSERPPYLAASLIVRSTNEFREEEGRREVKVDAKLNATARYFASYMARTGDYGHYADGSRPEERAAKHSYDYCIVSENIAYYYSTAGITTEDLMRGFVRGWRRSPEHRKNMLDPDVTEIGAAVARSQQTGYYYSVQMFGRPKSKLMKFMVRNNSDTAIRYEIADRTFSLPPRVTRTHRQCRPAELTVQWPTEQESTAVQPNNGDHYTVIRDDEGFRLKRE
jgi:uncharacterized protein YkwD